MNKAAAYMVIAPIFTSVLVYGYTKVRDSGGVASHFAYAIKQAKNRFTPGKQAG